MQTELLLATPDTETPSINTAPCTSDDHVRALGTALDEMRKARAPGTHAAAVDAALNAATPAFHRVATLFAASWPTQDVDVDDLVQEVLLELAAALDFAPRGTTHGIAAWLSSLAFDTLHGLRDAARRNARGEHSTTRFWLAEGTAEFLDLDVPNATSIVGHDMEMPRQDPPTTLLHHVLEALPLSHARIVALRRSG